VSRLTGVRIGIGFFVILVLVFSEIVLNYYILVIRGVGERFNKNYEFIADRDKKLIKIYTITAMIFLVVGSYLAAPDKKSYHRDNAPIEKNA
jgi:hypothetical protein